MGYVGGLGINLAAPVPTSVARSVSLDWSGINLRTIASFLSYLFCDDLSYLNIDVRQSVPSSRIRQLDTMTSRCGDTVRRNCCMLSLHL